MAGVALKGVHKAFSGGVTAVDGISLTVRDGELLVLLGPSGCGKTTTLRLIAGLEELTAGEIRIGDRVVTHLAPKDRDTAMVFQNYALYPHMSVYKNLALTLQWRYGGGWVRRVWRRLTDPVEAARLAAKRRAIGVRVGQTARMLGIEHLLDRLPGQLSGGQRQRVALGRAMVRQPAVFLFDEPLSNLDARLRLEMRRQLKQLHQRLQATMIYVTHDQTEALTLGDRVAVLDAGRLQQVSTPREVYQRPRNLFVAGFVGSPPMNLLEGRLESAAAGWEFVGRGLRVRFSGWSAQQLDRAEGPVVLGIRPEDVELAASVESAVACGLVSVVEPVGDASYVYTEIADSAREENNCIETVVYKTGPEARVQPGDEVPLAFKGARAHLFDAHCGANLTW